MPDSTPSSRITFPLALLFVIVTGAAVIAALIGPLLRDLQWRELEVGPVIAMLLAAVVGGSFLGAALGLFQFNRLIGVAVGAGVGGLVGPIALLLTTVPADKISSVVPAMCIGSVILLVIAWLVRPPAPPEETEEIVAATLAGGNDGPPKPPAP